MEYIDTRKATELVKDADRLPRAEIEALAEERLRFLVAYAREHSPYLKEKYEGLPDNFTLKDIPVSTRMEMVAHFDRWVCDPDINEKDVTEYASDFNNIFTPFLGKYAIVSTSGTTTAPLRIVRDARHLAVHGALMSQRYFHGPLLKDVPGIDDPFMKSCGIVPTGGFHSSYISFLKTQRAYEQHGAGDRIKHISLFSSTAKMVAELNEFQPYMIGSYPSSIYMLAHEQKAGRLAIRPGFIGCSAEKLSDENRRFISEAFGCPVNDNYCSTEGGEVAMLCPNGHLHLNSDWIIVEPVDKHFEPVPPGVRSEGILVTNLACLVQPVIRYYMSDIVTLYNEPCGCGLNTPYIDIGGRAEDMLEFEHGGHILHVTYPQLVISALHIPGCDTCQFIQRSNSEIELRIVTLETYDRQKTMDAVAEKVRKLLIELDLGHVSVSASDQPLVRTKGGKLRLLFKDFHR